MKRQRMCWKCGWLAAGIAGLLVFSPAATAQAPAEASAPQGVTVSIYDTGLGMVSEARRVTLGSGEQDVVIRQLPTRMDPSSASIGAVARAAPLEILEQRLQYDLADLHALFNRMSGQPVVVNMNGTSREGVLLSGPVAGADAPLPAHLPVRSRDGKDLWMIGLDRLSDVTFPFGRDLLAAEPRLVWRARSRQDGPQNFRLSYRTDGLEWRAHYEIRLAAGADLADFNARVELVNQSGGSYENARVRLLLTEKGLAGPILGDRDAGARPAMRYAYGVPEPAFERSIASLAPMEVYELPRTVTLEAGRTAHVQLLQSPSLPVKRIHIYDGVRFDRFQRNRRTDWNYGTEYHTAVQTHIEFENEEKFGLGVKLPPGLCRLYQVRADESIDLVGEDSLRAVAVGEAGHLRVGPAIGLTGARERTGYVEVRAHHVYEESFQIRLANATDETVEVRVVEHLYRWPEFEIIRADTDYTTTGPQTIEFRAELRPGGRRSIHYTVRYTW